MSAQAETAARKPAADAPPAPAPPSNDTQPPPAPSSASSGPPSAGGPGGQASPPFHSASLYVGDLAPDVNEGLLFDIFNAVGPVASIRVCRDAVTRRSLGYAYVNFHQVADAERALDTMNYTMIKSQPCRIMWSQRDPSLRRSGVGNIFVKNLNTSIDNKQLYDTFSLFGNILSCKVVTDPETNDSKGYGYVHYETAEAANAAIDKLDGMLIDGQEVNVGHFMRRQERPGQSDWTNCYVKNIPLDWDDAKLMTEFSKYGPVLSAAISMGLPKKKKKPVAPASVDQAMAKLSVDDKEKEKDEAKTDGDADAAAAPAEEKPEEEEEQPDMPEDDEVPEEIPAEDADGTPTVKTSLGYGFVSYEDHESAVASVEGLNGQVFPTPGEGEDANSTLYVGRAQKKSERERELRAKYEGLKMERISKFQGVNLYVKNLDEDVTDDNLRDAFAAIGTITSARVMRDAKEGRSRGFGFVCYSNPEEATRAVNEMNGKLMNGKPIFVALAQRKEIRRAQLEAQHATRPQPGMMRAPMGQPMAYPAVPMYMQRPGMQPAYPMVPQMMQGRGGGGGAGGAGGQGGGGSRYPMMQQGGGGGRGVYPMPVYAMPQGGGRGGRPGVQQGAGGRGAGGRGGRGGPGGPQSMGRGGPHSGGAGGPPGPNSAGPGPGLKYNQQARNAPPAAPPAPAAPHEPLTPAALAAASPEVQKNMIGERLYPLIHASQPELAGKITGMLLEMDNSELLNLLESPEALGSKIGEALQVLEAHNAATAASD